jgi:hypothetical protein
MVTRRPRLGTLVTVVLLPLLVSGCAAGGSVAPSTGGTASTTQISTPPTSSGATTEQPAVWPAAGTVMATPEQAATDFVRSTVGVTPQLGDFMAGDSRSGEIELIFGGESGTTTITRSVLLLRQLGPDDGWFVIAAANPAASITTPTPGATVAPGPLEVRGLGRGFEGTVLVEAFRPGQSEPLDRQIAQGGSMETAEPFTATLDLSSATPGETLAIVVNGGTGHELDPGELGAIPVVVGS